MEKVNISLHFSKQDHLVSFLLAVFLFLLPFTALLSHARLLLAAFLIFLLGLSLLVPVDTPPGAPFLELRKERKRQKLFFLSDLFFLLYVLHLLSGVVSKAALFPTLMSSLLCFYRALTRRHSLPVLPLLWGGGTAAAAAIAEYALGRASTSFADASRFGSLARAGAPFGNPNLLAAYLLPLFALLLALWEEKWDASLLPVALLLLGGIAVTFSRGAWVVALLLLAIFFVTRFGWLRPVLLLLASLPLLSLLLPDSVTARLFSLVSPDSSVGYRFSLWKSLFRMPLSHFLFGVGEGKEALFSALSPYMAAGLERVEHTHSLFLRFLTSGGVWGTLLLLLSFFFGFGEKRKGARRALLSLLLFGIFDDPLYGGQSEVLFWLFAGVF
ncbi:MAG: O-antigen ligase family protein [Clostridia bacterium]|nr:O-antigen ligase family protein [Clostridia bacterium]